MKPLFNYLTRLFVNSLKVRLMVSILAMVLIILPTIAVIIVNSFNKHMVRSIEKELSAYSYSILAVAEVEEAALVMPDALIENQFNVNRSGLYAFISKQVLKNTQDSALNSIQQYTQLWHSQSLLTLSLPEQLPQKITQLPVGKTTFNTIEFNDRLHFIYSYSVSFSQDEESFPLTVHVIRDKQTYLQLIDDFKKQLWIGLAILMVIIFLLQLVWLLWTLKPLSTLQQEVKAIEQGNAQRLTGFYPKELSQLTSQLNQLLDTEQKQRQRYRNALSDLAHSLKTPLAVLQAQNDISVVNQEQISRINSTIEHQLKRAQSAGHSSWFLGVEINPVVEKLLNTLTKIYRDTPKQILRQCNDKITFKGDEADLMELLGNLLDNAYKAARNSISITIVQQTNVLEMIVEDDGLGIKEQEVDTILLRGVRADTYQEGHGVGLAIVRDLVESYQGKLTIGRSEALGGAKITLSFDNAYTE